MKLRELLALSLVAVAGLLPTSRQQDEDIPHNDVMNWALKFGVDLYETGRLFTRMKEIQKKYNDRDAQVKRRDGLLLIREMAQEVKNMMDIKMNSIMRVMDSAEQAALSQRMDNEATSIKYFNSRQLRRHSESLLLSLNRHFDQRHVNTSHSSVIMPNFLSDTDTHVINALKWSEHLDPVFVSNYEVDPTLSWQYFGSSTGFLRRFPAMQWPPEESFSNPKELHDFRTSDWYVGASTSPKDLAILLDISSGMKGEPLRLAKITATTILNTIGDDDFVNIFTFSDTAQELVPCFRDLLVQGTAANKRDLVNALDAISLGSGANFTAAIVTGFEILQKYNRTGKGSQCNQALMLITSGHKGEFKPIIKEYNAPHMPVRVFTYLVGKDTTNSQELFGMACENKGYYEHIDKTDNIQEKVLNYLRVMARPMVMYQNDHPIHWTPVYAGGQSNTLVADSDPEAQLMTTVSTPIFDRRNTTVRTANLLGVVGNDIPIQQIKKLVPPYRVGVNGYSFMVNNNGHILYHPDLRPLLDKNLFIETLKPNYNSVDLTSVELLDSDLNPRDNNSLLNDLRNDMLNQKEGETELKIKIHYDEMKRVTSRRQKYFYHPIEGTPFTLGLAFPDGYGLYEVWAEEEIKLSQKNVTEYFKGKNWRVHPDWVYCEYNYAGEHRFGSPEEQVLHFLSRTRRPGWKWMSLRPRSISRSHDPGHGSTKKMEKDSYYCDKSLMQNLVFDAMATEGLLDPAAAEAINDNEHRGFELFGIKQSFVATRSGLFRWYDHKDSSHSDTSFADSNRHAVDEVWYKRAVEQYMIDPHSFVYSVPFNAGNNKDTLITATHAIFLEHKGHKAPAAVVGIQFLHEIVADHFINITGMCTGTKPCKKSCSSKDIDCYVLDNNGFIIISEKNEQTGHFFGQVDGTIMDSLVQDGIYKKIPIVDHQGACTDSKAHYSDASQRSMPWMPFKWLLKYLFTKLMWLTAQTQIFSFLNIQNVIAQDDSEGQISYAEYGDANVEYGLGGLDVESVASGGDRPSAPAGGNSEEVLDQVPPLPAPEPPVIQQKQHQNLTQYARPCVKKVDLYVLQPERLNSSGMLNPLKGKLTNCHQTGCERPFSVQKIYHSNLILLVVDTLCPCGSKQLNINPQEMEQEDSDLNCKPWEHNHSRRRPSKCINYHPEEIEIKQCGSGVSRSISFILLLSSVILSSA